MGLRRTVDDDDDGQYELVNDRKNNARTGAGADVVAARLAAWTCGDGRIRWPIAAKETKDSRVEPGEQSLACVVEAADNRSHEDSQIHTDLKGSHFRIGRCKTQLKRTNWDGEPRHRTNDSIGGRIEAGKRADKWTAVTDRVCVVVATAK
ncbi:uncharacterized protein PITG_13985 [Phytophthora infestans T30-4]|uniref:Uncharacterized protein n=1 Tax=Phytophthora infestans (strain T30-4) TaxID=403677 RepID=D0NN93_PHYIT|nr:uncharacterized protein PITG_13985 [Phytophthora infestans T30-4]EEY62000.1 conserved hypothetical protein [Phytophthora infestans T30-4]|eukprot:XP_002899640.1 conserved hypothetical protein [Phytophthora infestans T30-4]